MEYDPKDNEVVHLLKKLKNSNEAYPSEMLALRRERYLKQVADISAGAGLAAALRNIAKGGKGTTGASSIAGTVVEALLVAAIVAEAGVVTYFYRDKVAEVFRSITRSPNVEEVASPPVVSSPIVELQLTTSPVVTDTLMVTETETGTMTPAATSNTPSPVPAAGTAQPKGPDSVGVQSAATSVPSGNTGGNSGGPPASTDEPKGNSGNHYGQTPKPDRTKESGNSTSSDQVSNNDSKKNKP